MSRAASPALQIGLLFIVLLVTGAKLRAVDVPSCTQEINRCLAACRAVCMRRIADGEREKKTPQRRTSCPHV